MSVFQPPGGDGDDWHWSLVAWGLFGWAFSWSFETSWQSLETDGGLPGLWEGLQESSRLITAPANGARQTLAPIPETDAGTCWYILSTTVFLQSKHRPETWTSHLPAVQATGHVLPSAGMWAFCTHGDHGPDAAGHSVRQAHQIRQVHHRTSLGSPTVQDPVAGDGALEAAEATVPLLRRQTSYSRPGTPSTRGACMPTCFLFVLHGTVAAQRSCDESRWFSMPSVWFDLQPACTYVPWWAFTWSSSPGDFPSAWLVPGAHTIGIAVWLPVERRHIAAWNLQTRRQRPRSWPALEPWHRCSKRRTSHWNWAPIHGWPRPVEKTSTPFPTKRWISCPTGHNIRPCACWALWLNWHYDTTRSCKAFEKWIDSFFFWAQNRREPCTSWSKRQPSGNPRWRPRIRDTWCHSVNISCWHCWPHCAPERARSWRARRRTSSTACLSRREWSLPTAVSHSIDGTLWHRNWCWTRKLRSPTRRWSSTWTNFRRWCKRRNWLPASMHYGDSMHPARMPYPGACRFTWGETGPTSSYTNSHTTRCGWQWGRRWNLTPWDNHLWPRHFRPWHRSRRPNPRAKAKANTKQPSRSHERFSSSRCGCWHDPRCMQSDLAEWKQLVLCQCHRLLLVLDSLEPWITWEAFMGGTLDGTDSLFDTAGQHACRVDHDSMVSTNFVPMGTWAWSERLCKMHTQISDTAAAGSFRHALGKKIGNAWWHCSNWPQWSIQSHHTDHFTSDACCWHWTPDWHDFCLASGAWHAHGAFDCATVPLPANRSFSSRDHEECMRFDTGIWSTAACFHKCWHTGWHSRIYPSGWSCPHGLWSLGTLPIHLAYATNCCEQHWTGRLAAHQWRCATTTSLETAWMGAAKLGDDLADSHRLYAAAILCGPIGLLRQPWHYTAWWHACIISC